MSTGSGMLSSQLRLEIQVVKFDMEEAGIHSSSLFFCRLCCKKQHHAIILIEFTYHHFGNHHLETSQIPVQVAAL
jgi:hypothetical protein